MNELEQHALVTANNPAKAILTLIGALGVVQGFVGIPVGLFVDPHILIAAIGMLLLGASALWLGQRPFCRLERRATIIWGAFTIAAITIGLLISPPTDQDFYGVIFFALLSIAAAAIVFLAFCKRPIG